MVKREREGNSSKLDERLENFRDPETRNIVLTKNQAIIILIDALRGFYKEHVETPSLKIEALYSIVKSPLPYDTFNLTEIAEGMRVLQERRDQEQSDIDERIMEAGAIIPRERPQEEI